MRVVFMGTPSFAVPSLRLLCDAHEVSLVVTRPDAVRGRGRRLEPSPVKACATELGVPVLEASRVDDEVLLRVREAAPDIVCVAAYGAILPDELLAVAPLGTVNVHASLLPRWRGAAPIQRAILEGDEECGVSIMRIVRELDAGPYCAQASLRVGHKTCDVVMAELADLGADLLVDALGAIEDGRATWVEQDEALVTYAHKILKQELLLDPADASALNQRRVQASLDAAPARATVAGRGVRILDARVVAEPVGEGRVAVPKGRVLLGCADGTLEVLVAKPDGKREIPASAWASGLRGDLTWGRV